MAHPLVNVFFFARFPPLFLLFSRLTRHTTTTKLNNQMTFATTTTTTTKARERGQTKKKLKKNYDNRRKVSLDWAPTGGDGGKNNSTFFLHFPFRAHEAMARTTRVGGCFSFCSPEKETRCFFLLFYPDSLMALISDVRHPGTTFFFDGSDHFRLF